jgi:hypothetical protein
MSNFCAPLQDNDLYDIHAPVALCSASTVVPLTDFHEQPDEVVRRLAALKVEIPLPGFTETPPSIKYKSGSPGWAPVSPL